MLTISAGHFGKGTGAVGYLDEGSEVISVVDALQVRFRTSPVQAQFIVDTASKNQAQNLRYLIYAHNQTQRELDVSIHFNASGDTREAGIGTEVLYVNSGLEGFAKTMSAAVARAGGFLDRGAKHRTNLALLNGTQKPAIIIEICFVNSKTDVTNYSKNKAHIIEAIALTLESYFQTQPAISSPALLQKVQAMYHDKRSVQAQLEQGVNDGAYQAVWLETFKRGELTFIDYLAITTLQFQKNLNKL